MAAFLALAIIGWGHYTPQAVNAKLYAKTNLVNLAIWGLWWPAIVWVTFLLGRAWCIVCPLEFVSSKAERLSRNLRLQQRPISGWLAKGSLVVLFFAFLQMLVPGVQIHRVPHYTSLFLWISLAAAFFVGLFLKDRAFCRGFCPISLLLSAYGRGGMLAVRPSGGPRGQLDNNSPNARTCPSLLNPSRLNSNKDCLVCGQCLKADNAGSMELILRTPHSRTDARERLASWPQTLFVIIVSGFVAYELSGVWKTAEPVFLWAPKYLSAALNAGAGAGWIQGLWTIVAAPFLLWVVLGLVTVLLGGAKSLGEAWRRLALPAAIIVATGHMAKALEKFTSWIGYLPHAWTEPTGVHTAIEMNAKTMPQPVALIGLPSLSVAAVVLVALGIALALRETKLADANGANARCASILLLGAVYLFLALGWGGVMGYSL